VHPSVLVTCLSSKALFLLTRRKKNLVSVQFFFDPGPPIFWGGGWLVWEAVQTPEAEGIPPTPGCFSNDIEEWGWRGGSQNPLFKYK